MGNTETNRRSSLLWDRILESLEEDLAERRARKLVVRVRGESGPCEKEIGELSAAERRSLDPVLGEHVAEQLLDRYLAEQGYVDLIDRGHPLQKEDRRSHPGGPAGPRRSRPRENRGTPGEARTGEVRPRHAGSRRSAPSWRACGDGRGSLVEEGGLRWRS